MSKDTNSTEEATTPSGNTTDEGKQSVLVTGSSRGIGAAIAKRLAIAGLQPVLHCRSGITEAQAIAQAIAEAHQCTPPRILQFDISDREQCRAVLTEDIEAHGTYYGVVCNAGITRDGAFPALTGDDWDGVVHTNLDAFYNVLAPLVMPLVRRRKPGRIVTLSSVSGIIGNRGQTNYSAAKAGIIGATKALAVELAKRKITVNCVAPGLIETTMIEDAPLDKIMDNIPLRRLGKPEEVAGLVNFLMSDEAAYITRQVISVNGGMA